MAGLLQQGVVGAAIWAAAALTVEIGRTWSYGRPHAFARPAGSRLRAITYALGPAMLPTAKESAREHIGTWLLGVGYHAGIVASLLVLASRIAGPRPAGAPLSVLAGLALCGTLCGGGLLVRRCSTAWLRRLSRPDDFLANLLTTSFAALAFGATRWPALEPWLLAVAVLLLLYVPLGKIRHCAFFLVARCHAAAFFGRRGVLPPAA